VWVVWVVAVRIVRVVWVVAVRIVVEGDGEGRGGTSYRALIPPLIRLIRANPPRRFGRTIHVPYTHTKSQPSSDQPGPWLDGQCTEHGARCQTRQLHLRPRPSAKHAQCHRDSQRATSQTAELRSRPRW